MGIAWLFENWSLLPDWVKKAGYNKFITLWTRMFNEAMFWEILVYYIMNTGQTSENDFMYKKITFCLYEDL